MNQTEPGRYYMRLSSTVVKDHHLIEGQIPRRYHHRGRPPQLSTTVVLFIMERLRPEINAAYAKLKLVREVCFRWEILILIDNLILFVYFVEITLNLHSHLHGLH